MPGLPRQSFEIPLVKGLLTKGDKRAKPVDALEVAENIEFDDLGGLRVRFPFGPQTTNIIGGGTLSNCRKLATRNDELLVFTDTALYSYVPAEGGWAYRGDHLAIATDEQTVFAQADDQFCCDRAELNGRIVYTWQATSGGVFVAVADKATGAVIQAPTLMTGLGGAGSSHPRLIALSDCVILFLVASVFSSGTLQAYKITLGPWAITAPTTVTAFHIASGYDVCRVPGRDQIYAAADLGGGPRTYTIASIDSSLTVATVVTPNSCSGDPQQIAIAITPDAATCTVIVNDGNVRADIWTVPPTGAPATITTFNAHIGSNGTGTSPAQLTAAYKLVTDGGFYRCYVFWTLDEVDTTVSENRYNWIDTSGAQGFVYSSDDTRFVYGMGIGARAFARDSHVYLVGTFAGLSFAGSDPSGTHSELQNTYYLYRDDAFVIGKAVWGNGAGFHPPGWLPNVNVDSANVNRFVAMESIRRIVDVGPNTDLTPYGPPKIYAERAPREVAFVFDDDRARNSVQFGSTLYVTGSLVLQYDGAALTEVGFCTYPWLLNASAGGAGSIAAGGYSYKATDRWSNAAGEVDRSTTATVSNLTIGSSSKMAAEPPYLYITRKTNVAIEVWRTKANPNNGDPFFLVSSQDPSANGDNGYLLNDPTNRSLAVFTDNQDDATIALAAAFPENGGVLEAVEPPGASIITANDQRLLLAGIPGFPNTVFYSHLRQDGFVASFHDALTIEVPTDGGAITAVDVIDGNLIVWCETATYLYEGSGFDNTGGGSNFHLARIISTELGAVSQDAIQFGQTAWYLKTERGWYMLDLELNYTYIGEGPFRFDDEPVLSMVALTSRHQIRAITQSRMLVLDTLVNQWTTFSIADGLDAVLVNGDYTYLTATGPRAELETWNGYDGSDYSLTAAVIETTWLKPGGAQQGRYVLDFVQLLGEFRSSCKVRVQQARDYQQTSPGNPNWHTDKTWTPFPAIPGDSLELRSAPAIKRCASSKVRITITNPDGTSPLGGPCVRLTSLAGQFASEAPATSPVNPQLASAQKQ